MQLDSEFKQMQRELDQTKREKQSGQERNRILEEQNEYVRTIISDTIYRYDVNLWEVGSGGGPPRRGGCVRVVYRYSPPPRACARARSSGPLPTER